MVLSVVPSGDIRAVPGRIGIVLLRARCEGQIGAKSIGAQPNQRLKLPAPVPNESGERFTSGVVEFLCEPSNSAPQLKRDSLGCNISSYMCLVALIVLAAGALSGAMSSLFAYRARTLRVPVPSLWDVFLEGP